MGNGHVEFYFRTAVGDWLAESLRLGFLDTGVYPDCLWPLFTVSIFGRFEMPYILGSLMLT